MIPRHYIPTQRHFPTHAKSFLHRFLLPTTISMILKLKLVNQISIHIWNYEKYDNISVFAFYYRFYIPILFSFFLPWIISYSNSNRFVILSMNYKYQLKTLLHFMVKWSSKGKDKTEIIKKWINFIHILTFFGFFALC